MIIMALRSGLTLFLSLCCKNFCFGNFRLSDIVAIHVINPTTYGFTEAINISSPITFTLNLTLTPDTENYLYQVCPPSLLPNRKLLLSSPCVVGQGWIFSTHIITRESICQDVKSQYQVKLSFHSIRGDNHP